MAARGYKSVNIPSLQGPRKFREDKNFTTLISKNQLSIYSHKREMKFNREMCQDVQLFSLLQLLHTLMMVHLWDIL